jgi:hypothetical protein
MRQTVLRSVGGRISENPSVSEMSAALRELNASEGGGECRLRNEDGWCVTIYADRRAVLLGPETEVNPKYLLKLSEEASLFLWRCLQFGDLSALRAKRWQLGHEPGDGLARNRCTQRWNLAHAIFLGVFGSLEYMAATSAQARHGSLPSRWGDRMDPWQGFAVAGIALLGAYYTFWHTVRRAK